MPPHGGNPHLTDLEIERAITYIVNQSGGHWTEPISRASSRAERSGEQIVRTQCVKCHETGVGGAPRIGDRGAWIPRVKQGLDTLVLSAINGHGGMPPRGGLANLTDPEIRSAIVYMFNAGTVATKSSPVARVVTGQDLRVVDGTTIYFGVVPADVIRRHPKEYPKSVYGVVPFGPEQYYVTVALFDANDGQRIADAIVRARVSTTTIAGSPTYGNYFVMAGAGPYTITVHIRRPSTPDAIQAQFAYTHQ
jgi:cytochrome c5